MKLYLMEDHDLPVVAGIALVRTGGLLDPPQRIGLAQLAGITMRTGGTTLKTGEQIDILLDNLASNIDSAIGDSSGTFSFTGLKENAASHTAIVQGNAHPARFPTGQDGTRQDPVARRRLAPQR